MITSGELPLPGLGVETSQGLFYMGVGSSRVITVSDWPRPSVDRTVFTVSQTRLDATGLCRYQPVQFINVKYSNLMNMENNFPEFR